MRDVELIVERDGPWTCHLILESAVLKVSVLEVELVRWLTVF